LVVSGAEWLVGVDVLAVVDQQSNLIYRGL
jgi:hypothetical protein